MKLCSKIAPQQTSFNLISTTNINHRCHQKIFEKGGAQFRKIRGDQYLCFKNLHCYIHILYINCFVYCCNEVLDSHSANKIFLNIIYLFF